MRKISAVLLSLLAGSLFLAAQGPTAPGETCGTPPSNPLGELNAGNRRFRQRPGHPRQTLACVQKLKCCQKPWAIVLSCADSRIPPEVIFDQGIGDLFVVRVAGNVAGKVDGEGVKPPVLGRIKYPVDHGTGTIVVMGHQRCAAVEAAFGDRPASPNLGTIWDLIR